MFWRYEIVRLIKQVANHYQLFKYVSYKWYTTIVTISKENLSSSLIFHNFKTLYIRPYFNKASEYCPLNENTSMKFH